MTNAARGMSSRWVSFVYLGVAGVVMAAILLAAWIFSSRSPERQAKRWGLVQLQAIRQSRDHIRHQIASLDQGLRVLSTAPSMISEPVDPQAMAEEIGRTLTGLEVEGLHAQRFSTDGTLLSEVRPILLRSDSKYLRTPADMEELLVWSKDPSHRGETLTTLERVGGDIGSDTRLMARYVVAVWTRSSPGEAAAPAGFLLVRFPVKDFLGTYLIPAQLIPESYSFVFERASTSGLSATPASVLWHFKNPRWADAYLSDTDPFVRTILGSNEPEDGESFAVVNVPQGDDAMRREIVSTIPLMFGDRRWILGISTPYDEAVLATRGQQSFMLVLAGLTLAVLATGLVLLQYQRGRMQWEAQQERQSQLERMRHNYQELFAENPTAMIVVNPDGVVVDCNVSAEQLLGAPAREAQGRSLQDFFESAGIDLLWDRFRSQGFLPVMDARLVRRTDRRSALVETWGRRIGDQLILMAHDVEARRDLDRQIARLRRMDSMGSLASTIAHDFNNLLGQVQILVSNLRSDLDVDSNLHDDLATIEDKIEDASHLVGNLLSFRENVMSETPVYPEPVLRDFMHQQRKLLPERIELVSDIRPDLPSIWLTPTSLRRILDNLVLNAVDAMPAGGTLTVQARTTWIDAREATDQVRSGHYCVVEVSDTGVGMSTEILDTIFEPYFTTKTDGKGTGLGLWTIYKILRRARGAIHVHSKPGEGTRFTLYLAHSKPTEDIDSPGLEMARPNR